LTRAFYSCYSFGARGHKKFVVPMVRITKQRVMDKPVLKNQYHNY